MVCDPLAGMGGHGAWLAHRAYPPMKQPVDGGEVGRDADDGPAPQFKQLM